MFTSEDYGPVYAQLMGSRHVMIDRDRATFPVSGTAVRENPLRQGEMLEPCVRAYFVRRVVLIGAESTGKTTLAQQLAERFDTIWVPEYGDSRRVRARRVWRLSFSRAGIGSARRQFAEIAEFVSQKILPLYRAAIFPELMATFNPKGRGGHVRRLLLMHQLDPAAARPAVRQALDEGSPEVRTAAISCLGDSPEDPPFLLEQSRAKAKDVRTAALVALGSSGADDAGKVLCNAIDDADLSLAVEPIRASRNPAVTTFPA